MATHVGQALQGRSGSGAVQLSAFAKMRAVWEEQARGDALETRLWDVPHEFNAAMQEDAFRWLELQLR